MPQSITLIRRMILEKALTHTILVCNFAVLSAQVNSVNLLYIYIYAYNAKCIFNCEHISAHDHFECLELKYV